MPTLFLIDSTASAMRGLWNTQPVRDWHQWEIDMLGKMRDVQDKHGRVVLKVGPTVTSLGASFKAGFPVILAVRGGKCVWIQKGEPLPPEPRNRDFGSKGYQG